MKDRHIYIYEKIGDIAHQINKLKQLKDKEGSIPPTVDLPLHMDFDDLIDLHTNRIEFLKDCLELNDDAIKKIINENNNLLCENCKVNNRPCVDYKRLCENVLAENVLEYE